MPRRPGKQVQRSRPSSNRGGPLVPFLPQSVVFKTVSVSLPLSLVLFAYERALVPLYASVPTQYTLEKVLLITTVGAVFTDPIRFSVTSLFYAGVLLAVAPTTAYWVAAITARWRDPLGGPIVTHLLVLAPIVYFFVTIATNKDVSVFVISQARSAILNIPSYGLGYGSVAASRQLEHSIASRRLSTRLMMIATIFFSSTRLSKVLWPRVAFVNSITDSDVFLYLAGILLTFWITVRAWYPSIQTKTRHHMSQFKFLLPPTFLAIWVLIHPFMRSPVLSPPLREPFTHPTQPFRILSSARSTTGLIVVGEALPVDLASQEHANHPQSLRYLRASHSILGGVWIGDQIKTMDDASPISDEQGTPLGDSIYSAFVLQEAARLVERLNQRKRESALLIGLGVGISATAFSRHNMSTTIVEIDPAVYDAARRFFGLKDPGPGHVFLEDARGWVAQRRSVMAAGSAPTDVGNGKVFYDVVVHDCFSGGGVPKHLFTMEFWDDLKSVMHEDGVVAVNFVGKVNSDTSLAVFLTLEKSFGQCRAFHDLPEGVPKESDFVNMVFFCTNSSYPLTFRPARDADYLKSYLRRHVLSSLPDREVNLTPIRAQKMLDEKGRDKFILTDNHNPLDEWQKTGAFSHWKLMRELFPDTFWETY